MPGRIRKTGAVLADPLSGDAIRPALDDTSGERYYLIGDAVSLTGLTEHTLRAWERVGLLSPRRSPGGVRRYTEDDLARIRLIARTLDARRLSRRAVAALLASGDLRPSEADYQPTVGVPKAADAIPDDDGHMLRRSELQHALHDRRVLDAIAHVDQAVAAGASVDEILSIVCRECCEALGVAGALLWLVERFHREVGVDDGGGTNSPGRWLVLEAGHGPLAQGALRRSPRARVPYGDTRALMSQALLTRRGIQVGTMNAFAMAHPELPYLLPAAALAALPLQGRSGEPIGVLTLRVTDDSRGLSDDDLRSAQMFANAAALAIQAARLEDSLHAARRQANADEQRMAQRERCLAAVMRAAAEVQESSGDERRAARVLAAFVEHAGAPVVSASLHLLDRDHSTLRRVGMFGTSAAIRDAQAPADPSDARWHMLADAPLYSGSEGAAPAWYDDEMRAAWPTTGIRSWTAVPLRAGGELYGIWTIGFGVLNTWDAAERAWMEACAGAVALAVESDRRVATALRQAQELASVLQSISEGISVIDVAGHTLMRNAAAEAITARGSYVGNMSESASAYGLRDALSGALLPYERTPLARALRGESVHDAAVLMRDGIGRDRHILCSSGPVRDARGDILAAVTVFRDATAQMRPARLFERLGQQLGATLEPDDEMRVLADALTEVGGLDTVAIYMVEPDGGGLRLVAARNYPPEALGQGQRFPADAPTIAALALRTGQPQVAQRAEQVQGEDHALTRRMVKLLGVQSGAALPLLARGRVVGVLVVASYQPEAFPPDEVAMLLELAGCAGLAVDNAQLYQTARRTAAELDAIINAMADPVWVCDASGTLTRTNQAAEALLRMKAGSAPAEPLVQAFRGEPLVDEGRLVHAPDGGTSWLQTSSAPIRDDATGGIVGAVAVGHDITHLHEMQRMREEFLAVVAHELRTPLTSLLGFVQVSRRNASRQSCEAEQEPARGQMAASELLERVERQALRLDRLVGDLLDLVRIQQGRLQYRWTTGDVAGAVAEAVDEQRAAHADRQIELVVPDASLPARLDPDRLGQVVTNLLTNALKYSRVDQDVTVRVELSSVATEGASQASEAVVRVRDHGPGIPREHLACLFERFYRVPGVEVQSGSGIGLGVGLYVAHEIVQRHGGRIWAESEPGQGSTFTFTVPLLAE